MKATASKIKTLEELKSLIKQWQEGGDEVVFTNGCFDILHLGHIDYLEKSRDLGNKLVIGLNSDNSVRRIKGEERPL
ncbi:adenylyltransferase/cytidyltransferase family protein, partial [Fulvivirga lutimaris]|uniref:adenylyltransferase/cytidyltransferase family protein n=1 Tax=Fulvivirga lutimaris TaxID=1819566 RepID=UPI0012BCC011